MPLESKHQGVCMMNWQVLWGSVSAVAHVSRLADLILQLWLQWDLRAHWKMILLDTRFVVCLAFVVEGNRGGNVQGDVQGHS